MLSTPPWGLLVLRQAPLRSSSACASCLVAKQICAVRLDSPKLKAEAKCFTKLEADQVPRVFSHLRFLDKMVRSSCFWSHQGWSKLHLKRKLLEGVTVKLFF